jgi:hypothetical protein
MGITPIISLLPLPVARAIQADLDPLPMARVENSARTGDETYSPSGGKSAGGSEENSSEDNGSEDTAFECEFASLQNEDELSSQRNEDGAEAIAQPDGSSESRPISFFA